MALIKSHTGYFCFHVEAGRPGLRHMSVSRDQGPMLWWHVLSLESEEFMCSEIFMHPCNCSKALQKMFNMCSGDLKFDPSSLYGFAQPIEAMIGALCKPRGFFIIYLSQFGL